VLQQGVVAHSRPGVTGLDSAVTRYWSTVVGMAGRSWHTARLHLVADSWHKFHQEEASSVQWDFEELPPQSQSQRQGLWKATCSFKTKTFDATMEATASSKREAKEKASELVLRRLIHDEPQWAAAYWDRLSERKHVGEQMMRLKTASTLDSMGPDRTEPTPSDPESARTGGDADLENDSRRALAQASLQQLQVVASGEGEFEGTEDRESAGSAVLRSGGAASDHGEARAGAPASKRSRATSQRKSFEEDPHGVGGANGYNRLAEEATRRQQEQQLQQYVSGGETNMDAIGSSTDGGTKSSSGSRTGSEGATSKSSLPKNDVSDHLATSSSVLVGSNWHTARLQLVADKWHKFKDVGDMQPGKVIWQFEPLSARNEKSKWKAVCTFTASDLEAVAEATAKSKRAAKECASELVLNRLIDSEPRVASAYWKLFGAQTMSGLEQRRSVHRKRKSSADSNRHTAEGMSDASAQDEDKEGSTGKTMENDSVGGQSAAVSPPSADHVRSNNGVGGATGGAARHSNRQRPKPEGFQPATMKRRSKSTSKTEDGPGEQKAARKEKKGFAIRKPVLVRSVKHNLVHPMLSPKRHTAADRQEPVEPSTTRKARAPSSEKRQPRQDSSSDSNVQAMTQTAVLSSADLAAIEDEQAATAKRANVDDRKETSEKASAIRRKSGNKRSSSELPHDQPPANTSQRHRTFRLIHNDNYLGSSLREEDRKNWAAAGVLPYVRLGANGEDIRILLGRQGPAKRGSSKYWDALVFLGGKREKEDLTARHTAAREAMEETGGLLFAGRSRSVRGPVLWFPPGRYALFLLEMKPSMVNLPVRFYLKYVSWQRQAASVLHRLPVRALYS